MSTTSTLADIKVLSQNAFSSVTTTNDDTLYFVEEEQSNITEYSSGASGYIIFPGGLCIQWGQLSATMVGTTQNLAKTYANTNYATYAVAYVAGRGNYIMSCANTNASQIKIYTSTNCNCKWMTIGQLASGQY